MLRAGLVSVLVVMCACSAQPGLNPGADSTGGAVGAAAAGAGGAASGADAGPTSSGTSPAAVAAQCQIPPGDRLQLDSIGAMRAALQRTWAHCSDPGLFHRPQDGMVIDANDRFAFLAWSNGNLVRLAGLDNEGTVQYLDTSAMNGRPTIQVNFVSDLGNTIISRPVVSNVPRTLIIDNMGIETYTYTATDAPAGPAATPDASVPPTGPFSPDQAAALCARPVGERLSVADDATLRALLQRAWVLCSPAGLFGPQDGIVIDPDDRFALLSWTGGQLVRQQGLENEGSLRYLSWVDSNGDPHFQVDFVGDAGFMISAAPPVISDDPRMLLIDNGVAPYTYAAVP